ncbi:MAG TPA: hypothetical protein DEP23_05240 [Ruminococcaceae bacterium]|jgi:hypothetical protein|nr:hypothetical protein [Oscillospiraceae bacterium]
MREILFRGKRIDNGKWESGYFADMGNKACIVKSYEPYWDEDCKEFRCRQSKIIPVDLSTVGQFTGLTDKNGKKIFEGDILEVKTLHDGDEEYWSQPCGSAIPTVAEWGNRGWCLPYRVTADFAIIGNIYDNPELLSKKVVKV